MMSSTKLTPMPRGRGSRKNPLSPASGERVRVRGCATIITDCRLLRRFLQTCPVLRHALNPRCPTRSWRKYVPMFPGLRSLHRGMQSSIRQTDDREAPELPYHDEGRQEKALSDQCCHRVSRDRPVGALREAARFRAHEQRLQ